MDSNDVEMSSESDDDEMLFNLLGKDGKMDSEDVEMSSTFKLYL